MTRLFEPGTYKARITRWVVGESSNGHPQVVFTFLVEYRVLPDGTEASAPQYERSVFRTITDKTVDFVVRDLQNLGYDRSSFAELDPEHPSAYDFRDREVTVSVKYHDYEGKEQEKWEFAFGTGGPQVKPLSDRKALSKLDAQFGDRFKASKNGTGLPKPPPRQGGAKPGTSQTGKSDEDVPF